MSKQITMLFWLLSATACAGDTTTGRTVRLHARIEADAEIADQFATETGWSVRLNKAALGLRALYYFDAPPAFVRRDRRGWLRHAARLLLGGVARAHPGHYMAGSALGQMLEPAAVDLLGGGQPLAEGMGVSGVYRSARFVLAEAEQGDLAGLVALAEGVATKAERTVHFRLSADFAEISRSASDGQVDGCKFEEADVEADGSVTVTVEPHVWFNLVDFSDVAPGSAEQPTQIGPDETARIAFALGVAQLSAYQFSYIPR